MSTTKHVCLLQACDYFLSLESQKELSVSTKINGFNSLLITEFFLSFSFS